MQDYKSLCVAVMTCATLVNIDTLRLVILLPQPAMQLAELKQLPELPTWQCIVTFAITSYVCLCVNAHVAY